MSDKPFHFKQFTIHQDQCAAKIGTDGVLLGAWASLEHHLHSILDIGTGTGVIALMLAQRSTAEIVDAIELDDCAFEQAAQNFENSDWSDRLFCYHAHLYEFALEIEEKYDLIISNPPFYRANSLPLASLLKGENYGSEARKKARFQDALPFDLLVGAAIKLLSPNGSFCVIIPFEEEKDFLTLCANGNLYPYRITRVKGTPTSEIKRSMIDLRFRESINIEPTIDELIIEIERHNYTSAYQNLVKDFYLKM